MSRIPALTALLFAGSVANAGEWTIDPAHSRVGFEVTHLMISSVEGDFTNVAGTATYEPGDLKSLSVEVTVVIDSVDSGNADRDAHLKKADFLDAENFPTMTFTSTRVKPGKGGAFDLYGDLTLRGVTKQVVLHGKGLEQVVTDPWGNQRVGATATGVIDRHDFGVAFNQALETGGVMVGADVTLDLAVEFIATKGE